MVEGCSSCQQPSLVDSAAPETVFWRAEELAAAQEARLDLVLRQGSSVYPAHLHQMALVQLLELVLLGRVEVGLPSGGKRSRQRATQGCRTPRASRSAFGTWTWRCLQWPRPITFGRLPRGCSFSTCRPGWEEGARRSTGGTFATLRISPELRFRPSIIVDQLWH